MSNVDLEQRKTRTLRNLGLIKEIFPNSPEYPTWDSGRAESATVKKKVFKTIT